MKTYFKKTKFWIAWAAVTGILLIAHGMMNASVDALAKSYGNNVSALNAAVPGFSEQSIGRMEDDIRLLKGGIAGLAKIFYSGQAWKKNYDLSILFVEDLNNANQMLRTRSEETGSNPVTLDFTSKLPSAEDAVYLLAQLKGLKDLVAAGMESQGVWTAVKPLAMERVEGYDGVRMVKSSLEGVFPSETVLDFMVRSRGISPLVCLDLLGFKAGPEGVRVNMNISHLIADFSDWQDKGAAVPPVVDPGREDIQRAISVVKGNNPFIVTSRPPQRVSVENAPAEVQPVQRFFFRGKARLRNNDVAVIEDTLSGQTVFLKQNEVYKDFRVKTFSGEEAILENTGDGDTTILKRGG